MIEFRDCPDCGNALGNASRCDGCGLQVDVLRAVLAKARRDALYAAAHFVARRPQEAYDAAAASLSSVHCGNNLASVVLLASTLEGARGSTGYVLRPDEGAFGTQESAHAIHEIVEVVRQLRRMLTTAEADPAGAGVAVESVREQFPVLLDSSEESTEVLPQKGQERRIRHVPLFIAAAIVITVFFIGRWIGINHVAGTSTVESQETDSAFKALVDRPQEVELADTTHPATVALPDIPTPVPLEFSGEDPAFSRLREETALRAWLYGYEASGKANPELAIQLLAIAVDWGDGKYFHDDAQFYLARNYHRIAASTKASRLYREIIAKNGDEGDYVADARRRLGEINDENSTEKDP